jgi:hypothetical protein
LKQAKGDTNMEFKLLIDLIDAFGKVAGGLKAIGNLPQAERKSICQTLVDTYSLTDTPLNMVIVRLGDILIRATGQGQRVAAGRAGVLIEAMGRAASIPNTASLTTRVGSFPMRSLRC